MKIFNYGFFFYFTFIFSETIDVTFRYVKHPDDDFIRIFVPGTMPEGTINDWGPNSNGVINPNAQSLMNFNSENQSYHRKYSLEIGQEYEYKFHTHHNSSGTDYSWFQDPLNPETTSGDYDNSLLIISDPLFFQHFFHLSEEELVTGMSLSIASSSSIDSIKYVIAEESNLATANQFQDGVFFVSFDEPSSFFDSYRILVYINGNEYVAFSKDQVAVFEEDIPDFLEFGPSQINDAMYLSIRLPGHQFVQVRINNINYEEDVSTFTLKKDPTLSDVWWTQLELSNGVYDYEYSLPNGATFPDPLSRMIKNNKTRIEIGAGGVTTADDYEWISEGYIKPDLDTLIIYELHVDDFSAIGNGAGTFQHVLEKLNYLKNLGINAIELMPISEFPGIHSWGYDPQIISAINGNYGTPAQFKYFVDQCHANGIAVIIDIIWNHIRSSSPLWKMQPDYNLNPYIKHHEEMNQNEAPGSWGMLDIDHFNSYTIEYINKVHRIWVDEYKVDGFRFDAAAHLGWSTSQLDLGIYGWSNALKIHDSTVYQIAEHLPANINLIENSNFSAGWHDSFHDKLKMDSHNQYNSTLDIMRQIIGLHEYSNWGTPYTNMNHAVKYMVSHDEQSLIQEMVEFNNFTMGQALARDKFYATILFTSNGIPMLWQGQEFGFKSGWTDQNQNGNWDEEKLSYRPLDWSILDTENGQNHLEHYKKLISLRKRNSALSNGDFYDLYKYTNQGVIVYGYKDERVNSANDQIIIIANFSSNVQNIVDVPFLSNGNWYNVFDSNDVLHTADGNYASYNINAKSAVVYTNNQYQLAIQDSIIQNNITNDVSINNIKLFPNPFNSAISITLETQLKDKIRFSIYNILGKKIFEQIAYNIKKGTNTFLWNGRDFNKQEVATGMYFVQFEQNTTIHNQKIIFVK
tara:strand:+ start:3699 stop:6437 length:2739 start_codon:yes stop_codon:yes gene_type:complete